MASSEDSEHLQRLYRSIKTVIRKIPRGHVATYGQIAELAGIPNGARIAAAALKTSKPADGLPWQRVIGKAGKLRGRIAIHDPVGAAIQRQLLAEEGVHVSETGGVSLADHGWRAERPTPAPKRKRATARSKARSKRRS